MKWSVRSPFPRRLHSARSRHRHLPFAVEVELLEVRLVLSAAFDVTDLTALRDLPQFAEIDGALPDDTKIGIAIIDSGVLGSHADLQSNFLAFFDAVATDANADGIITPRSPNPPRERSIRTAMARTFRERRHRPIRTSAWRRGRA